MKTYSPQEIKDTLEVLDSTIHKCEKAQIKFNEGTSQHTLLKNRLNALYLSKTLILDKKNEYTKEELKQALVPIQSIINKCTKAIEKHTVGSPFYKRFDQLIKAMEICKDYIGGTLNV